ncbi:ATP-binding protein [Bacillus sp. BHET2]|uniref:ATP-binding protein n=1 Tax=Bacillus sp. BHET2 TaxID=2583818 RepID=UPI00110F5557|nr:ATP-binding protein [Bacillus sp. BHET2]TMU87313.1 ATP-binding protein [Bacillus sp. BHET2]
MTLHRDVLSISITDNEELILASDCSGGIGRKSADMVQVDPEIVGYFCLRVAAMECLAVGASLKAVQLMNFTSDSVWGKYSSGVKKGLIELGLGAIPITGSSESNFLLKQSALGVTCIGMREKHSDETIHDDLSYALIGTPLVGDEVMAHLSSVAPLPLFMRCIHHSSIIDLLPVGSKGVLAELSLLIGEPLSKGEVTSVHDVEKSSGPSTSFIISYHKEAEKEVRDLTGSYFHSLHLYSHNK